MAPQTGLAPRWRRALVPSFADFFFLSVLVWLFLTGPGGWSRLLEDGDTGWHIRTGEIILDTGAVPRRDPFSFSKAGAPWFAWEWGADVIYAALYRTSGFKGVVLLAGVQVAAFGVLLLRWMVWAGVHPLLALPAALLALAASGIHHLARPHLFTLVLLPAALWLVEADRRRPGRAVWWLVPLAAVWANLHGGFLALVACLGLLAAGCLAESLTAPAQARAARRAGRRYAVLAVLCLAASALNPYGLELHRHLAEYLRSDWIPEAVDEFQSPRFRRPGMLPYEILLVAGLMSAPALLGRRRIGEALWVLFWAHQSLASVRHVTVFVTVAGPVAAAEAGRLWRRWCAGRPKRDPRSILDGLGRDMAGGFGRMSVWPALVVAGLAGLNGACAWPRDFPATRFPAGMIARHPEQFRGKRVLTTDQWADYLLFRHYPQVRVFFDGRSDFYGPELGKEYVRLATGQPDWERIADKHGFETALVPPDWALASLLVRHPVWRLVARDDNSLLFARHEVVGTNGPGRAIGGGTGPGGKTARGLMCRPCFAEISGGDPSE